MSLKSITVALSEPLATHKGEVKELTISEPRARAFVQYGEPFDMIFKDGDVTIKYHNDAMMKFLADMTGIDATILGGLPASDYRLARDRATSLIAGLAGENPTGT